MRRTGSLLVPALALAVCMPAQQLQRTSAAAEPLRLSLEQASARRDGDFAPLYEGRLVMVKGVAPARAFHFVEYTLLPIHQDRGGIAIRVSPGDTRLDSFRAGDEIEVTGFIGGLAGMPIIYPKTLQSLGRRAPATPQRVPVSDLLGYRYLARLVETEGRVEEVGDNTAGSYLLIAAGRNNHLKVFFPSSPHQPAAISGISVGDTVRATGVAFQYCPRPPYNRWFEVLVQDSTQIVPSQRGWLLPRWAVPTGLALLFGGAWLAWRRERRLRDQRERLRRVYHLGEEVLGAPSIQAILKRVAGALPDVLGVSRVRLYVHNRAAKTLEAVTDDPSEAASISLTSPPGGTQAGAAACFHYRTLLAIPDIARSPFPVVAENGERQPKSLLFAPMMAQGEVVGVFELDQDDRSREFTVDEQSLAQHLGNQIGVAIRLLDQRSVQEQLYRTEKLAAVGRLISGVVNELQTPLRSIVELAGMAQEKPHFCPAEREVRAISTEAQKASSIVARLVSFAGEPVESRPVDMNTLLRNLIEFRAHDWKASGIKVRDLVGREPMLVLGSEGQLEQVVLNLLVHAEQSLNDVEEKSLSIQSSLLARRVLVEISFAGAESRDTDEGAAAVLGVVRSVVGGHGGEVRLVTTPGGDTRFEIELPWAARERAAAAAVRVQDPGRQMTALVIEPDETSQRQLLTLLSARGYRVVPVNNSDTGLELAHRLRFDVVLCSVHSPGLNWVELSERLQPRVGAFVLLSDGYDSELAGDFEGEGRFVLAKPIQESELDRVLGSAEPADTVVRARTA